jgi:hypothetical protein
MTRSLKLEGYEDGRVYQDGERRRVFLQTGFSSRGKELLEDARSETSDETQNQRRASGLGEY